MKEAPGISPGPQHEGHGTRGYFRSSMAPFAFSAAMAVLPLLQAASAPSIRRRAAAMSPLLLTKTGSQRKP